MCVAFAFANLESSTISQMLQFPKKPKNSQLTISLKYFRVTPVVHFIISTEQLLCGYVICKIDLLTKSLIH